MFGKAAKIRIPTAVSFYLLTLLLSIALLSPITSSGGSVLSVNTRNFFFGVATTLLAHAAVYLLARGRTPAWAMLYILALVVPLFPPEAMALSERGALYWGILAGLLAYTATYGARYFFGLGSETAGEDGKEERRRKVDRRTSELFDLLNVTKSSEALRAVRKLIQERDRRLNQSGSAADVAEANEAAHLQEKFKGAQHELKQLRRRLEEAKQPHDTERRELQQRLEKANRTIEETVEAKDRAEERAQSVQAFQIKIAELTQQVNSLRSENQEKEQLLRGLQERISTVESARDEVLAKCRRLESELVRVNSRTREASTVGAAKFAAPHDIENEVSSLKLQVESAESRYQQLSDRLRDSEESRAVARHEVHTLNEEIVRLRSRLDSLPADLEPEKSRAAMLKDEQDRVAAELAALQSELREKARELTHATTQIASLQQTVQRKQTEHEAAQKEITRLRDYLAFHERTVEELTPEIDRLDEIIGRYEAAYGPPPSK